METGFVTLTCTATGNPPPNVVWVHDNKTLQLDNVTISPGSPPVTVATVQVYGVNATGDEVYTCIAEDTETSAISQQRLFLRECKYTVFENAYCLKCTSV